MKHEDQQYCKLQWTIIAVLCAIGAIIFIQNGIYQSAEVREFVDIQADLEQVKADLGDLKVAGEKQTKGIEQGRKAVDGSLEHFSDFLDATNRWNYMHEWRQFESFVELDCKVASARDDILKAIADQPIASITFEAAPLSIESLPSCGGPVDSITPAAEPCEPERQCRGRRLFQHLRGR